MGSPSPDLINAVSQDPIQASEGNQYNSMPSIDIDALVHGVENLDIEHCDSVAQVSNDARVETNPESPVAQAQTCILPGLKASSGDVLCSDIDTYIRVIGAVILDEMMIPDIDVATSSGHRSPTQDELVSHRYKYWTQG